MALQKFMCFDLRTGIMALSAFHLVSLVFSVLVLLVTSMDDSDPDEAAEATLSLGSAVVALMLNSSLAYGAYKEKRAFLLPYLVIAGVVGSILTLLCLYLIFFAPLLVIILLILLVYFWYVWYAVLSLYQLLDPHNPNYTPQQMPSTIVYVEESKPPAYYENSGAEEV